MSSAKIKKTLSKFYASGDETAEEIDDKNFDRLVIDDKHLTSSNSSTKTCMLGAKNKMKNRSIVGSDAPIKTSKLVKEDVIDGFAILSFGTFDDLEDFIKNSRGRPSCGGYREDRISQEQKPKRQNNTPSCNLSKHSLPVKPLEITHVSKQEVDDSSSDATVEENVEDRMMTSFGDLGESGATPASSETSLDFKGSGEMAKVTLKRPADEGDDPIESKRALWDKAEVKPSLETLYQSSPYSINPGSEPNPSKPGLKREVEDEDALIEGVTRKEGSNSAPRNEAKPIIKTDCDQDVLNPIFSGALSNIDTKVDMAPIKKEASSKRRSPTPDDVVVVLDDSSSHSGGASWIRCYSGLVYGDGKALRNDSQLLGCARTDVRYDASRVKNKHKNIPGDRKGHCLSGRKTSSIGPLSSSSSITSSKTGFSPRHRGRADSPRMSDRLPPFRPPAFVPPRLTPPMHAGGGFCLPMPTVVPPTGLGVPLPPQQPPLMMPGWGQFELLAAQMAANQEMLRVQQGLNDRFLQDGNGSLRTMPLLGTGINIPMAIPGLQPTLTLRTEMHQHQHLHHHQHVVPASPYTPLPTVPPPVHPMQTQMAPPMYFQPSTNIFSSSIHARPGLPTRGAFMPMADYRSNSLPASQLLAKLRDRDWKQSNVNGRPGFKGKWCSAHVQLAWRILMHCRGLKQQAEDAPYGSKFNNLKINESLSFKPSIGRIGSPPPLRQGWPSSTLGIKSERAGRESADLRILDFGRKERETVLRINSGRGQVEDFPYSSHHLPSHFLHQPSANAFSDKKDFLIDGLGSFNRNLPSNDSSYYVSNKTSLNPFTSSLTPFLPLGEDLFRNQQDRKLMADKYSTTASKDTRMSPADSHHRNRTPSNSSLNSFPFFPPPGPNSSIQSSLHLPGLQSQRYGSSSVSKPHGKQDLPLGFPSFHTGTFNKPYPGSELMGGSLLPHMLDPSRRSPFLKHSDPGLAPSPSGHPHMWGSYPPGMYPPAATSKLQEGTQTKGSMCIPPPLLPPYR